MKKYLPWADYVRVSALFLVIILHSAAVYVLRWGTIPVSWWLVGNIVDSFSRVAVPLFIMLSGALLLARREPARLFYLKRIVRVVVPWLFWATLVFCYHVLLVDSSALVKKPLATLFNSYVTSYWYVVLLVVVYVLKPGISLILAKVTRVQKWLMVAGLLAFATLFSVWIEIYSHPRLVQLAWLVAFLGYFMAGDLVRAAYQKNQLKKYRHYLVVAAVLSWLVTLLGTFWLTHQQDRFIQLFYDYAFISVAVQAVCIFSLVMTYSDQLFATLKKRPQLSQAVVSISKRSYGVFLTQSLVASLLLSLDFVSSALGWIGPVFFIPLFSITIFLICYGACYVLSKLPVLRLVV